jgi:dihydrofolate synthase/folylpolyglutamate synthase
MLFYTQTSPMSYAAALAQLNAMAPELFSQPGQPRRKFSLDQVHTLLAALGDPQARFPSVLIAGTNGKGSTAATLASILTESGLKAGLYTSPHLERVNERIRIGRTLISDDEFARQFFRVHAAAQKLVAEGREPQLPSFFEYLTALAFLHFAEVGVDIAVLEVGMGGRLDATNVVDPLLSIITDISLDHMEWLGSTIGQITREKAGILRRGGTLITLPQHPEASQVLGEVAGELEVRAVSAVPYMPPLNVRGAQAYPVEALGTTIELASPLLGMHQHRNTALAVAAAVDLTESHGFPITPAAIAEGVRRTSWPGRLERFTRDGVDWVLDVAHNPAGAWSLRSGLRDALDDEGRPWILVFSCLRDKPVAELAQILFPLFKQVIFAPIQSLRATPLEDLMAAARATGTPAVATGSVAEALAWANRGSGSPAENGRGPADRPVIVVSGSVYLVGEARGILMSHIEQKEHAV